MLVYSDRCMIPALVCQGVSGILSVLSMLQRLSALCSAQARCPIWNRGQACGGDIILLGADSGRAGPLRRLNCMVGPHPRGRSSEADSRRGRVLCSEAHWGRRPWPLSGLLAERESAWQILGQTALLPGSVHGNAAHKYSFMRAAGCCRATDSCHGQTE
jgi:hypothetical protein